MSKLFKWEIILILIIIVVSIRIGNILFEQKFWSDQQVQIIGAFSLLDGKGVSLPISDPYNLSLINYKPISQFPEGYSYLFAGVYSVCKKIYCSAVCIDLISLILYLLACFILARSFRFNPQSVILLLIFTGFSISPFIFYTSSDFLALALFFMGSAVCLISLKEKKTGYIFISAILLAFSSFIRYSYYPLIFAVPVSIMFAAFINKNRRHIINSLLMLLTIAVLFVTEQLIKTHSGVLPDYLQVHTAHSNFVLYPGNLEKFNYQFIIQPFMDTRFFHTFFKFVHITSLETITKDIVSFAFFIVITSGIIQFMLNYFRRIRGQWMGSETYIFMLFITALTSMIVITGMSLISPPQNSDIFLNWTFVEESRYFALIFVFVLFFSLIIYNNYNNYFGTLWVKIIRYFLVSFAIISLVYFAPSYYSTIKNQPGYFRADERTFLFKQTGDLKLALSIDNIISQNKSKGLKTVFISNSRISNLAVIMGSVYGSEAMLSKFNPDKSSGLLLLRDKDSGPGLIKFIESNKLEPVYKSDLISLYQYLPE